MKSLDLALFYDESFVDFIVKNTNLNLAEKCMVIYTMGAWLDCDEPKVLSEARLLINEWYSMRVLVLNEDTKEFETVCNVEDYFLSDIIKFHYEESKLRLEGFGINGGWVQWEFIKPKVRILGDIK